MHKTKTKTKIRQLLKTTKNSLCAQNQNQKKKRKEEEEGIKEQFTSDAT